MSCLVISRLSISLVFPSVLCRFVVVVPFVVTVGLPWALIPCVPYFVPRAPWFSTGLVFHWLSALLLIKAYLLLNLSASSFLTALALLSSLQVESTHKRPLLFQEHQSISRNLWYTFNSVSCNASPTMHLLHHISDCLFRSNKHVMYTLSRTYYIMLLNWNIEAYNNVWIM